MAILTTSPLRNSGKYCICFSPSSKPWMLARNKNFSQNRPQVWDYTRETVFKRPSTLKEPIVEPRHAHADNQHTRQACHSAHVSPRPDDPNASTSRRTQSPRLPGFGTKRAENEFEPKEKIPAPGPTTRRSNTTHVHEEDKNTLNERLKS